MHSSFLLQLNETYMRQRVMRFRTAPVVSGVEQQIRWDLESISSLAATPLPSEFAESFIIKCSLLAILSSVEFIAKRYPRHFVLQPSESTTLRFFATFKTGRNKIRRKLDENQFTIIRYTIMDRTLSNRHRERANA